YAPYEIPERILNGWREASAHGKESFAAWEKNYKATAPQIRRSFDAMLSSEVSDTALAALQDFKNKAVKDKPNIASRAASGQVLEVLNEFIPSLIGGSADLSGSNLTKAKSASSVVQRDNYAGRYIHYGVREHGMAAVMNGLALHGGFIPYGGTFLVFSDYNRPAIRLAALMEQRVIHVMTHDSIGLGEDGPTHQPIEHLSALRAIPNTYVFRPADVVETAECWELALGITGAPSILALSRQNLPCLRTDTKENLSARGAYILREAEGAAKVVMMATGSEVTIALEAQKLLQEMDIPARVVSVPCMELFAQQDAAYRRDILPPGILRVAVEAAGRMSWDKYLGEDGIFIGMQSFGASAPYEDLYKHFGITPAAIAGKVKDKLGK
ncbi:MAG TPA: transketolase C-terminal domain-containing protein, partial [Alphaproteobacteria bacterium]|nr:transketolase C-terminal domain-containing protein [Alphaproteobacteria bacterium]